MFNRSLVLVAIDDRTIVERTVGAAVGIAKQNGAEVHALEVISSDDAGPTYNPLRAAVPASGLDVGAGIGARLAHVRRSAKRAGVHVRPVTLRGRPEHAIAAYGQLHLATVLVVERDYGTSGLWRNARVVRELARRAPMPLLVLPSSWRRGGAEQEPRFHHIVAPVDFMLASAVAVQTALGLARRHGSRLTLLHAIDNVPNHMIYSGTEASRVIDRLPAERRAVTARLQRNALALGADDADVEVVTGEADRAILEVAKQRDADLVVMGVAPRAWLDRTLLGSTLQRVVRQAEIPILVVPVIGGAHEWPDAAGEIGDESRNARVQRQPAA
jgi:nucleotide-binding universal stress UspA family protein